VAARQRRGGEHALELTQTAYDQTSEKPAILDLYGLLSTESDDADKALEILRIAHTNDLKDLTISYHLGLTLQKLTANKRQFRSCKRT
jgi:hypothetical protein